MDKDYININRLLWNAKTDFHVDSAFYDNERFKKGESSLNTIELDLLKEDLTGKKVLHLQCHFGQDSISLARMGAQLTAVDFSDKAIEKGRQLAEETNVQVEFICSDIYELKKNCTEQFDLVFTSYGTIPWLPDLDKWADIIDHFLVPQGQLLFVEFHPFVWTFDDDFKELKYSYFNRGQIIEEEEGTYAERNADIKQSSVTWNHPISEVLGSLMRVGLKLTHFSEYDYSPYPCFKDTIKIDERKYVIKGIEGKLPMVYALSCIKQD